MSRQFTTTRYVAATLSLALLVAALASPSRGERLNAVNKTASGRVTHVTLYRGQAMVTRTVPSGRTRRTYRRARGCLT